MRHEVSARTGRALDPLQSRLPRARISPQTQRAQPLHLLALKRLVDALNGDGLFFVYNEAIYADDYRLLAINLLLVFVSGVLDFLLYIPAFQTL